ELFGDCALAEIQTVVRALLDRYELLQPVRRPEHGVDAAPTRAFRHAGVLRMAPHLHLVLLGDRDHALEEIGDALPVGVRIHPAGDRQGRILLRTLEDELAVARWPAPLGA